MCDLTMLFLMKIASSLPNSTDWNGTERSCSSTQLQFILEEIPLSGRRSGRGGGRLVSPTESTRSLPVSRPGSPPTTEQIARALDNLLIHDSESVMEEPDTDDTTDTHDTRGRIGLDWIRLDLIGFDWIELWTVANGDYPDSVSRAKAN